MESAVPYNLKPKATKLPEGPDDSLDPPVPPTDAERRGIPPIFWAAIDKSKGGTAPPDAPLAPPATDPARRSVPPLIWPRGLPGRLPNRPLAETMRPPLTLDPDIALWPNFRVSIWPFAGAPTEGIWPKGWMGVDNTSTVYVCTVGGEPGTWVALGFAGGAGWPAVNGTGPGNLVAQTPGGDTVGYNITDKGTGGIALTAGGTGGGIGLVDQSGVGIVLLVQSGGGPISVLSEGGLFLQDNSTGVGGSTGGIKLTAPSGLTSGPGIFLDDGGSPGGIEIGAQGTGTNAILLSVTTGTQPIRLENAGSGGIVMTATTGPITGTAGSFEQIGDSGWANMALQNGWTVTSGDVARYRKLNGMVTVDFNVEGGTNGGLALLPAGFRPATTTNPKWFPITVVNSGTIVGGVSQVVGTGQITADNYDFPTIADQAVGYFSFIAEQ